MLTALLRVLAAAAAVSAALAPPAAVLAPPAAVLAPPPTALAPPSSLELPVGAALAPLCPTSDETCCRYNGFSGHEHFFTLHNNSDFLVLYTGRELVLKCKDDGFSLNDACVPHFSSALSVIRVTLAGCLPAPGGGGGGGGVLAAALRALGVRPAAMRQLELRLPRDATVSAELLGEPEQLAALQMLALIAPPGSSVALSAATAAALERLPALSSLHVTGIRLPENASLPRSLRTLRLEGAGASSALSREQLTSLPSLAALALRDVELSAPPPLVAAPSLRSATIEGPLSGLPELLNVENITFKGASSLQWFGGCGALRRLRVVGGGEQGAEGGEVPAGWLVHCGALLELGVTSRGLRALPADLLDYTPELRALDISGNKLTFLDSGMLQRAPRLEALDASRNALSASAAAAVRVLPALRALRLDRNPLGDLCAPAAPSARLAVPVLSPLAGLTALERLSLAATGAGRVCTDWPRRLPALRALHLQRNNITQLQAIDLQWTSRDGKEGGAVGGAGGGGEGGAGGAAWLDLRGNPLRELRLRRADYLLLPEEPQPVNVIVLVDSALQCDCAAYWAVRALRERRLPAELRARCAPLAPLAPLAPAPAPLAPAPVSLQRVPLQDMTCPIEESAGCPRGCRCRWGAHDNATDVACAGAAAARLPAVGGLPATALRLQVSRGHLRTLPDALPDNLVTLDVSNNNISDVSAAASAALLARGRRVRLARNPLRCACAGAGGGGGGGGGGALLRALAAHRAQVEDYAEVTCDDGRWVGDVELLAELEACGAWRGAGPALAAAGAVLALGALLAAGAALLLRRSALARLKAREIARALCPALCLASDPDDDAEYDVFLSFAHGDRAAAERIQRALEGAGQRVCLHSRDWRAGDFIPAQIAHSVAVSRRTVVLLSERFACSSWARAELRLAAARALREARPRLLVVLLDETPPPLDPELARYVADHTYLSYADPRFWDKLRRVTAAPTAPTARLDRADVIAVSADSESAKKSTPPVFNTIDTKSRLDVTLCA